MTAQDFLDRLPADEEAPDRALKFRGAVSASRSSPEDWLLAKEVYRVATSNGSRFTSLHDVNMLIYSLIDNPELLQTVREDMDRFLRRLYGSNQPMLAAWMWVQQAKGLRKDAG